MANNKMTVLDLSAISGGAAVYDIYGKGLIYDDKENITLISDGTSWIFSTLDDGGNGSKVKANDIITIGAKYSSNGRGYPFIDFKSYNTSGTTVSGRLRLTLDGYTSNNYDLILPNVNGTLATREWVQEQGYSSGGADGNYYHTPTYTTGLSIATGTGVSALYVPMATTSRLGVVKSAASRSSSISPTTGGTTSGRYYGVELDSDGTMFVNVPWTDTDSGDTKVTQNHVVSNVAYPLLMSATADTTSTTTRGATTAVLNNDIYAIPADGTIHAKTFDAATSIKTSKFYAPTSSNGTTYGAGTSGQVLKSNGTSVYWGDDNTGISSDTKVTNTLSNTTKFYLTGTSSSTTNTGTQYFNSSFYIDTDSTLRGGYVNFYSISGGSITGGNLIVGDGGYVKTNSFYAPTSSDSTTYGYGSSGQVLKSNGKTIYWGDDNTGSGTSSDTKVSQDHSSAQNNFPILMSATSGITSTGTRGATTAILNNQIWGMPYAGVLGATEFDAKNKVAIGSSDTLTTLLATTSGISVNNNISLDAGKYIKTNTIQAPTSSNGTTYGVGSSGQVLKSNGTSIYWGDDNNTQLTQYYTVTSNAAYPIIYSYSTATGTSGSKTTYGAVKSGFTFNPYTNTLKVGGETLLKGYTTSSMSSTSQMTKLAIYTDSSGYLHIDTI